MQTDLSKLLAISAARHSHLCPRQVLGVRIGLAGLESIGVSLPAQKRQALAILESDGCFADGVEAATQCTVGLRTMRIEDYGKIAASFINLETGAAVRAAPRRDIRQRADWLAPETDSHYAAMLQAYQVMPVDELLVITPIRLRQPLEAIISQAGLRAVCSRCGEEVFNQREVVLDGMVLCKTCTGVGYYRL